MAEHLNPKVDQLGIQSFDRAVGESKPTSGGVVTGHLAEHHPYRSANAAHPADVYGARDETPVLPALLRALAAEGAIHSARSLDLLPGRDPTQETDETEWRLAWSRYHENFVTFTGAYNLHLVLTELAKHSPSAAEDVALDIVEAYEAGDSYGEWLWQWAGEHGLDAERLIAEDRACPDCGAAHREYEAKLAALRPAGGAS